MERQLIKIDERLCNGCGDCVTGCAEGALQIIDGKARLVSDLLCDGLGACIGQCPVGAISFETRTAEPYSEEFVLNDMVKKGENTVLAHLRHLTEHGQTAYVAEALAILRSRKDRLGFDLDLFLAKLARGMEPDHHHGGGCPGARIRTFEPLSPPAQTSSPVPSALRQWPIQLHLVNPMAAYFQGAHVLVAADCVAYALGDFHQRHLAGKSLVIACPKLDSGMDVYVDKITRLLDEARVTGMTVMVMDVPCCGGLVQMVRKGLLQAKNKVPITVTVVGLKGDSVSESPLDPGVGKSQSLLFR